MVKFHPHSFISLPCQTHLLTGVMGDGFTAWRQGATVRKRCGRGDGQMALLRHQPGKRPRPGAEPRGSGTPPSHTQLHHTPLVTRPLEDSVNKLNFICDFSKSPQFRLLKSSREWGSRKHFFSTSARQMWKGLNYRKLTIQQ